MSRPQITHYKIVTGLDHLQVATDVKVWIDDGWQPLGGVSVAVRTSEEGTTFRFAQAVVKYEQETL